MKDERPSRALSQAIAIGAVIVLAAVVTALAIWAYQRANPPAANRSTAPIPSFSLGITASTPSPTPTPTSSMSYRAIERFLAVGDSAIWRAVGGRCGTAAPSVQRSTDLGVTWTDVTPTYKGIGQVVSLDAVAGSEAEMVTGLGVDCQPNALRTYTQGRFWDSYPDVLAVSRFVDLADANSVHTGRESTVAAPCPDARGLRANGTRVAVVCGETAYVLAGESWAPVNVSDVMAVAVPVDDDSSIFIAHRTSNCAGIAVTIADTSGALSGPPIVCAPADSSGPIALAVRDSEVTLWSGDRLQRVPVP